MKEILADKNLVAKCGLYCGACKKYRKGICEGCAGNVKATWCSVRKCCTAARIASCAECSICTTVNDCSLFNNFFATVFGFIFRTDRAACIAMIRDKGYDAYVRHMTDAKMMAIKK
ncbi:MAG: hypothetical protein ABSH12_03315 [Endomicrobiales bacterium]